MRRAMRTIPMALVVPAALLLSACTPTVNVKHEVEPIHLTADINIRVDRELEDFFAYQDRGNGATTQATQPTTATATGDSQ